MCIAKRVKKIDVFISKSNVRLSFSLADAAIYHSRDNWDTEPGVQERLARLKETASFVKRCTIDFLRALTKNNANRYILSGYWVSVGWKICSTQAESCS